MRTASRATEAFRTLAAAAAMAFVAAADARLVAGSFPATTSLGGEVADEFFPAPDAAPAYVGGSSDEDGPADPPFVTPNPWSIPPDATEPTGYDPDTGEVTPEAGRLDPTPPAKPPAPRPGPGGPPGGGFGPRLEYRTTWFPDRPVAGQATELGLWRQDGSASFPIAPVASGLVSGTVGFGHEATTTGAVLPDSGLPFPDDLWSVSVGTNYMRKFDNGWTGGSGMSVGSASDEPFADVDVLQVSANGFVRIPRGERDAWLLSLFYAPMSELPFPIPGVAYQWQPSDEFKANIGLPFSAAYTPTDRLSFEANYLPIRTVRARASYGLLDSLKAYAGYERSNRSWFLADRPGEDDRLFLYDQRLASGLEWSFTEKLTADLSGGYAFDRFYFQGENFDDRHRDRIDVADGPFLAAQLQGRW